MLHAGVQLERHFPDHDLVARLEPLRFQSVDQAGGFETAFEIREGRLVGRD